MISENHPHNSNLYRNFFLSLMAYYYYSVLFADLKAGGRLLGVDILFLDSQVFRYKLIIIFV